MSDGNYNRNLLPYNNYKSGVKAGQSQMRQLALEAFDRWYNEQFPAASEETTRMARKRFRDLLG